MLAPKKVPSLKRYSPPMRRTELEGVNTDAMVAAALMLSSCPPIPINVLFIRLDVVLL